MTTFIIGIIAISVAFSAGFMASFLFQKTKRHSGVIKVIRDDERVLYSLELHEDPVMLEHMSEVVFKVETSDESS